jgi:hypothetical protein
MAAFPAYLSAAVSLEAWAYILSGKTDLSEIELADWTAVAKKKFGHLHKVQPFSCPVGYSPYVVKLHVDDIPEFIDEKASFELSSVKYNGTKITLVNDVVAPGPGKVYAQNASGVKGWYEWATVLENQGTVGDATPAHKLLSAAHYDTVPADAETNALIAGDPNRVWKKLIPPGRKQVLVNEKGVITWGPVPCKFSLVPGDPWPRLKTTNGVPGAGWDDGRYYYGTNKNGALGFWKWSDVDCKEEPPPGDKPPPGGGPLPPPPVPRDNCSCGTQTGSLRVVIHNVAAFGGADVTFHGIINCSRSEIDENNMRITKATAIVRQCSTHNCGGSCSPGTTYSNFGVNVTFQPGSNGGTQIMVRGGFHVSEGDWDGTPNNGSMCVSVEIELTCANSKITITGSDWMNKDDSGNPVRPSGPEACESLGYVLGNMYYDAAAQQIVLPIEFNRCLQNGSGVAAVANIACSNGGFNGQLVLGALVPEDGNCHNRFQLRHNLVIADDSVCNICITRITAQCLGVPAGTEFPENTCYHVGKNNGPDNGAPPMGNPGDFPGIGPGQGPLDDGGGMDGNGGDGQDGADVPDANCLPVPGGEPQGAAIPPDIKDGKEWPAPNVIEGGRVKVKVVEETFTVTLPWFETIDAGQTHVNKKPNNWGFRWPKDGTITINWGDFNDSAMVNFTVPKNAAPDPHPDSTLAEAFLNNFFNLDRGKPIFEYRKAGNAHLDADGGKRFGYVTVFISIEPQGDVLKDAKFGSEKNPLVAMKKFSVSVSGIFFLGAVQYVDGTIQRFVIAPRGGWNISSIEGKAIGGTGSNYRTWGFMSVVWPEDEGVTKVLWNPISPDFDPNAAITYRSWGILGYGTPTYGLTPQSMSIININDFVNVADPSDAARIQNRGFPAFSEASLDRGFNMIKRFAIIPCILTVPVKRLKPIPVFRGLNPDNPANINKGVIMVKDDAGNDIQLTLNKAFKDDYIPLIGISANHQQFGGLTQNVILDPMENYNLWVTPFDFVDDAANPAQDWKLTYIKPRVKIRYRIRFVSV